MTRLKHVLILIILVLPMFALAPSLVASPNRTLVSQEKVDTSLPAQFVEETLRVAVYAESNLTLPAYATGGVYTDNYQNVIDLLESAGYAVTALSTQDILDHELMVANYDAFVLPDQLPRENITNHILDYWLGGGGILSFESSIGYLFYSGMIDPSYEGDFMLFPTNPSGLWAYQTYDGVYTLSRHPVTKSLEANTEYPFTEDAIYVGGFELGPLLGLRYIELAIWPGNPSWTSLIAFDNPDRGGKIVYLPGDCGSFETWMEPVVVDAVDWIAPRPKARVAIDFSHVPYYGVDLWDENVTFVPRYQIWRDAIVNHSYTFDKLYPVPSEELTADDLEPYDVLIINMPNINYTASEISIIRTWVQDGGGLYLIGEGPGYTLYNQRIEDIIYDLGITFYDGASIPASSMVNELVLHPIFEGVTSYTIPAGSYLNITAPAYPLAYFGQPDVALAGRDYGAGRIILFGDVNHFDHNYIDDTNNYKMSTNIINWLSSATAKVLLYNDEFIDPDMSGVAPARALESLGINFFLTNNDYYFNYSLYDSWDQWDLVIIDQPGFIMNAYLDNIQEWVEAGGELIASLYWTHATSPDHTLWPILGFTPNATAGDQPDIHIWEPSNPIFNRPVDYGATLFRPTFDYGTEGTALHVLDNARSLAGLSVSEEENQSIIVLRNDEQTLFNGFLIDEFQGDYDNSTYMDSFELWINEIGFMYFDRPTIDSPADVTYMETETGNEITWIPIADAGPLEYIFSVNGTPVESGPWTGGSFTFGIDGVNESITDYSLTVYDILGYSASDTVMLNVTPYVEPPGPGPDGIDPMLLLIIGGAVGVVLILAVVCSKRGKTE